MTSRDRGFKEGESSTWACIIFNKIGPVWPRLIFQNQFPNWSQNATAHFQTENTSYDVFLAHSGRQKDFVEQLYEDMTRHGIKVFFDKKSLEKGQEFPEHLLKAAATSTIAVPVLSEDFFMASSWPMAEIIASVSAKKPILYPLFYMISSETAKDVKKVAEWSAQWDSWGMERHNMGVEQWKETLKKIGITYGEEKNVFMSEVEYRKNVVACVSRMLKPNKQTTGAASSEMVQVGGSKSAGRKFLGRFVVGVPIGLGVGVGKEFPSWQSMSSREQQWVATRIHATTAEAGAMITWVGATLVGAWIMTMKAEVETMVVGILNGVEATMAIVMRVAEVEAVGVVV